MHCDYPSLCIGVFVKDHWKLISFDTHRGVLSIISLVLLVDFLRFGTGMYVNSVFMCWIVGLASL